MYRPEYNAKGDSLEWNFKSLEMQKWIILTDRAQSKDEKMGSFV